MLDAPLGEVELLYTEADGTTFGFGTPASIEVI